jgi:hypothetical protein
MARLTALLLLAGCTSLQVWAQTPQNQNPPAPAASAAKNSVGQDQSGQPATGKPGTDFGAPPSELPAPSTDFYLDKFQEFSATMTGSVVPGHEDPGYIYRSHNMMRMQGNHAVPSYFVTDLKKKETHGLAASGCIKLGTLYSRAFPFFLSGPDSKYTYQPAGEDTIDGHPVKIVDVTITVPKHPVIPLRFYEAQDLQGFPIRIENHKRHGMSWTLDYTDVRLGPQDPSLFIVPDKCQSGAGPAGPKASAPPKSPATTAKPKQ